MTETPGKIIRIVGATLFVVLLSLTLWSIFKPGSDKPLSPDEQRRMEDLLERSKSPSDPRDN